jgi:hypothetical protein
MFKPRDWHTSMNMLQTIYKVFWVNVLNPMKMFLGWKHISNDVRGCYFLAARLVRYVNNAISTYLLHCYLLAMYDNIAKKILIGVELDVL